MAHRALTPRAFGPCGVPGLHFFSFEDHPGDAHMAKPLPGVPPRVLLVTGMGTCPPLRGASHRAFDLGEKVTSLALPGALDTGPSGQGFDSGLVIWRRLEFVGASKVVERCALQVRVSAEQIDGCLELLNGWCNPAVGACLLEIDVAQRQVSHAELVI